MKRISVVVSFIVLLSMVLAACAPAATPAATQPPAAAQPTTPPASSSQPVTIDFWYIPFTNWDTALNKIIADFQAANPNITVNATQVPYEDFTTKVATTVPTGQGPDVLTPYHGWIATYQKSGFIAPIPEDVLPTSQLKNDLVSAADVLVFDGKYYAVPFYMMDYALFYNKDYFAKAGITTVPTTWYELEDAAKKCTQRDSSGKMVVNGYYQLFSQQDHIIWKNLLIQWGAPLFSADYKKALWNTSQAGYDAWTWFTELTTKDKVSQPNFNDSAYAAFYTGQACMIIAGPQVIGQIKSQAPDLNYGTAPLVKGPATDEAAANHNIAQYWSFAITSKAAKDPAKYEASAKFLKYLISDAAVKTYSPIIGALPPTKSMMSDPMYTEDPYLKAFLTGLPYSQALFWVDEQGERQLAIDMGDKVLINGEDPKAVLDWGTAQEQALLDKYWAP
ncbi:MAG: ABC transporter substrate-binding protein [Chloroflexi bacterium]|nr:ABC transporter substrate-binding protein [Chloroflexota bacterium]